MQYLLHKLIDRKWRKECEYGNILYQLTERSTNDRREKKEESELVLAKKKKSIWNILYSP